MASPYRRVILKLSGEALGLDGKLFCAVLMPLIQAYITQKVLSYHLLSF